MDRKVVWQGRPIHSWGQFHHIVRSSDQPLLARLDDFDDSVLVAGCQRSGTTALARLLKQADGIADHSFGADDELDDALVLAGWVQNLTGGRHCFQTTYLNDRFPEYFEHRVFRLIWIIREPRSVVYSMLHNWKRAALDRLFQTGGRSKFRSGGHRRLLLQGLMGPTPLEKACASYVAKMAQTAMLCEQLGERVLIVDYDDLVLNRDELLPKICTFAGVPFDNRLLNQLHGNSSRKGNRLPPWQATQVDDFCSAVYLDARSLRTIGQSLAVY
jgi:hypothetical protein